MRQLDIYPNAFVVPVSHSTARHPFFLKSSAKLKQFTAKSTLICLFDEIKTVIFNIYQKILVKNNKMY